MPPAKGLTAKEEIRMILIYRDLLIIIIYYVISAFGMKNNGHHDEAEVKKDYPKGKM